MQTLEEKLLRKCNYFVASENFDDIYNSHPNYPSLYAITESYSQLGIENAALRIPKDQIDELPTHFMAQIADQKSEGLSLVTKKNDAFMVESYEQKKQTYSKKQFLEQWTGIVLLVEDNPNKETSSFKLTKSLVFAVVLLGVIVLPHIKAQSFILEVCIYQCIALAGIAIGYFVIEKDISNSRNNLGNAICNMGKSKNCEAVLESDFGKLPGNISLKELPLVYFMSNLLFLSFSVAYPIVGLVSILSVPIIAYSIYLQSVKIKSWCTFCLITAALLALNSTTYIAIHGVTQFTIPTTISLVIYAIVGLLVYQIIHQFIQFQKEQNILKHTSYEFKRFKNNPDIFTSCTKPLDFSNEYQKLPLIELGNPKAANNLTLFLSPFCGHCHKAYKTAIELLETGDNNLSLTIGFNVNPENEQNPSIPILKAILNIYLAAPEQIKEALYDKHIEPMQREEWLKKWDKPLKNEAQINHLLYAQYTWCQKNNFAYTPVKVINGQLFPNEYQLTDLKYLLNELTETTTVAVAS
ncbi:vitamin K epoxide reductase family protein [Neptunitalea lumnitzerae]|uniref:Vitamin K epoxide reductase domain-containing protein n=1 Tax=Neptunitalea lumnitzerae TaxID=2965509 RepID=A0ABQ5MGS3_9FLAO|nr:vitamin K epoxide reductase family protein [Neptunitalea sp. Y10]GLB48615.1 hypothetical protein Y10_09830 [Neptunitalea sp. Y10]